jgi:phage shock protein A
MSRATREYTKYSDFNENATHKSSLASLCVFCRDLIIAYDKMDADFKKLIVDESGTYENNIKGLKEAIQLRRDETKEVIKMVLGKAHRIRQERDESTTLKPFEKVMDIFVNVSDASVNDDPLHVELEGKVDSLESKIADLENELTSAKNKLALAETNSQINASNSNKELLDAQKS